jgi:signal peptidase I
MARLRRTWLKRGLEAMAIVFDAALALVLGLGLTAAFLVQLAGATGHSLVVITGGSMSPAIPLGSLVAVEPVRDPGSLAVGEVVTVRTGTDRAAVTHRIERVVPRSGAVWLELRGDANATPDPVLVPANAVLGRAIAAWPVLGRAMASVWNGAGVRLVLGLCATLYLTSMVLRELAERAGHGRPPAGGAVPARQIA